MSSEIVLIPAGWLGYVKNEQGEDEQGLALALRSGGQEILFGSAADKATKWISIGDFYLEPSVVPEVEDEEVEAVEGGEVPPAEDGQVVVQTEAGASPFGRRRGG